MRRKSERSSATKKSKVSPEKKVDKTKRTRTKRRKQSVSSENDSVEETTSVQEIESVETNSEPKELQTTVKESEIEETHEQVWQVKTAEGSGDVGEIQKLKICLTRPPSTPEMVESSPHSKRKQSRTTSSSDTPSTEGGDERKKKKHSKRSSRESKDGTEKSLDSHDDSEIDCKKLENCSMENTEAPAMSNANDASISQELNPDSKNDLTTDQDTSENQICNSGNNVEVNKDADTTVVSSQSADTCNNSDTEKISTNDEPSMEVMLDNNDTSSKPEPEDQGKQENLESNNSNEVIVATTEEEVSNNDKENRAYDEANRENKASENNVLDTSESEKRGSGETSADSGKEKELDHDSEQQDLKRSDSTQSNQDESVQHEAVLVINRKRRWGSRPNKITTQKSITISTDILKEIIPDVKPVEFEEIIEEKKQHKRVEISETIDRPVLPKIVIDNTEHIDHKKDREQKTEKETTKVKEPHLGVNRKISIVKDNGSIITRPPSPPRNKQSCILFITNLVRPFTLPQLKNLLQRTGRIIEDGFWIDKIKSKCFVKYETEDQAVETRHALHGVTWPVSNPKTLHVDFSTQEAFDNAKINEEQDNAKVSTVPGTVEDWLREQDAKRERGDLEKPWERKTIVREWDVGKNGKEKEKEKFIRDDHLIEKRRHRTPERSPEPARKFKRKEEEAPAKLLDDLFRKTKSVPCIYWLPLSAETIAIKEEQRRKHMAEHERRMSELRRTQRRH